jgi:hypothetical protein
MIELLSKKKNSLEIRKFKQRKTYGVLKYRSTLFFYFGVVLSGLSKSCVLGIGNKLHGCTGQSQIIETHIRRTIPARQ